MKKMLVVVGFVAISGILYACGSSGSKSSGGGTGITTTVAAPAISAQTTVTSTNAAKTVNASKALASSLVSGSMFPSLGSLVGKPAPDRTADGHRIISTVRDMQRRAAGIVEKQKTLEKQVAAAQTQACTDGGTMSVDTSSNPMSMTFSACKMDNEYNNGTISFPSGLGSSTPSGTLTVNLTTISYATAGYTTKTSESSLNMTMSIAAYNSATGSVNFSLNGTESSIDYHAGTSDKQSFGNFSLNMTESSSGSVATTTMTMNGSVSMDTFKDTTFTSIDTASGMTFQSLKLVEAVNSSTSATALSIDGTFAIKTIPSCNDGTFVISTQTPITTTSGGITTGQMTVNGVVMVFNADGSVTATINGTPQVITSYANACSLSF